MTGRVFISHNLDNFGPIDFAIRIVSLIGCIPVIVEKVPKLSRSVPNVVSDTLDSCDAAIVIATPDNDSKSGKVPSQGVIIEIGHLQRMRKFKGKYVIIKEESVVLSPMIPETRYTFKMNDYSQIAEAILIELGSMGLFRNYYQIPGSDLEIHKLMETLSNIKSMKELIGEDKIPSIVDKLIRDIIENMLKR